MSIVTVQVTCSSSSVVSERRFDKGLTIAALKARTWHSVAHAMTQYTQAKLEMITGADAGHQDLRLYDAANHEVCRLEPNDAMLGASPVADGWRIHVRFHQSSSDDLFLLFDCCRTIYFHHHRITTTATSRHCRLHIAALTAWQVVDTNPFKSKGEFEDVSKVQKFELADEEYDKRTGMHALAARISSHITTHAQTRCVLSRPATSWAASIPSSRLSSSRKHVCQHRIISTSHVLPGRGGGGTGRQHTQGRPLHCDHQGPAHPSWRGALRRCVTPTTCRHLSSHACIYVPGRTEFQEGWWVGVKCDEPVGKNDGSVEGVPYFACPVKHGIFARPSNVTTGDYPEEDISFDDDEM